MAAELSVDVAEEMQVLPEIYGSDYEVRPAVWNYPSFAIKVTSSANSYNGRTPMSVVVKFTLSASYPKTGPKYEVEDCRGLSVEEKKGVNAVIDACIKESLNNVMIYEIVSALQSYIDNDVQSFNAESCYDAMMRREKEQKTFVESLKRGTHDSPAVDGRKSAAVPAPTPVGVGAGAAPAVPSMGLDSMGLDSLDVTVVLADSRKTPARAVSANNNATTTNTNNNVNTAAKPAPLAGDDSLSEEDSEAEESLSLSYDVSKSRYAQEFLELERLGNGASGEVWRVRHKLDRRVYAVKKIDLNSRNNAAGNKIQREVTTISRLVHKNIVRYYAAWIEQYEAKKSDNASAVKTAASTTTKAEEKTTCSTNSLGLQPSSGNIWLAGNAFTAEAEREAWGAPRTKDDLLISFEGSSEGEDLSAFRMSRRIRPLYQFSSSDEDEDEDDESESESEEDDSEEEESSEEDESDNDESESNHPRFRRSNSSEEEKDEKDSEGGPVAAAQPRTARWMFIQMEFCCSTMREEIDKHELWKESQEINRLLRQMLEALAYMHKCKVIHRDLKPANIFLDGEKNVKLGDFGLATFGSQKEQEKERRLASANGDAPFHDLAAAERSLSQLDLSLSAHSGITQETLENLALTAGIGTALYRAPEQELASPQRNNTKVADDEEEEYTVPYNEKADMYSLGIILFEMCHKPFSTGMERLVTIKRLRETENNREKDALPADFSSYVSEELLKIILWLTQRDAKQRPSAAQLLNSQLLPARADVDDQYLREITEALCKPNSSASSRILSVIFEREQLTHAQGQPLMLTDGTVQDESVIYDWAALKRIEVLLKSHVLVPQQKTAQTQSHRRSTSSATAAVSASDTDKSRQRVVALQYYAAVKRRLRAVFESRGAVDFFSQLLELRATARASLVDVEEAQKGDHLVELLDRSAQAVVLQPDLVTSFARLTALLNISSAHRFCFDRVFAPLCGDNAKHVQPWNEEQAVFDVIAPASSRAQALLADVEVLSTLRAMLSALQNALLPSAIRLSHTSLAQAVVSVCLWEGESCVADIQPEAELLRKLQRALSHIPDCNTHREAEEYINGQGFPTTIVSRLLPLSRALIMQNPHRHACDPLKVLSALEREFYALKEVSLPSSTTQPTEKDKAKEKEREKEKEKEKEKEREREKTAQQKSADFTPLNLDHIGVKAKATNPTNTNATPTAATPGTVRKDKERETDTAVRRRDRGSSLGCMQSEIVREWATLFEQGLQHLKEVFRLLALQKSMRDLLSAKSELGDLSVLEKDLQLRSSEIVLDLGVDAISSPFNVRPYLSDGLRFVVEGYLVSSTTNNNNGDAGDATPTVTATATAENANASKVESRRRKKQQQQGENTGPHYKRMKRGVFIDGGHFEKLIAERRAQVRSRHEASKIVACGMRVHLENLVTMILKHDCRSHAKLPQSATHIVQSERLVALVVTGGGHVSSPSLSELDAKSLAVVTNWLQSQHIRASYNVHQLQGYIPHSPLDLCIELGIPVLVTIDPDNYAQVDVQMQILNGAQEHPETMSLQKLPAWIRENVNSEYLRFTQMSPQAMVLPSALTSSLFTTASASSGRVEVTPSPITPAEEEEQDRVLFAMNLVTSTSSSDNDIFSNKKKKKELDQLLAKLRSAMLVVSPLLSADKLTFKPLSDTSIKSKFTGVVIAVDVPLSLLRTMNTFLMCKSAHPQVFKAEFEALVAQDHATVYRKVLKNYLAALITHMQALLLAKPQSLEPNTSGKVVTGKSSAPGKGATATASVAKHIVYTFSPMDELMDILQVSPEHVTHLRGV